MPCIRGGSDEDFIVGCDAPKSDFYFQWVHLVHLQAIPAAEHREEAIVIKMTSAEVHISGRKLVDVVAGLRAKDVRWIGSDGDTPSKDPLAVHISNVVVTLEND